MNWEIFYLVCFVFGLSLTVLAALGAFAHLHLGHFHLNLGKSGHSQLPHVNARFSGKPGISSVNGFTIAAFLCWFGGCGYLLDRFGGLVAPAILAVATVSGFAGAAILFWFLARVLLPHEHALTAAETDIHGILGQVSSPIRESGTGEIFFSQNGSRRFAPARSEAGVAIPRGTEVVVMRYEQGIAWVRRWDELTGAANPEAANHPEQPNKQFS